ncbi:MAG: hypothetical protein ABL956_03630 [Hyphomonadaceae bacterium]
MARGEDKPLKKDGAGRKQTPASLRLVRDAPSKRSGVVPVLETGGNEHGWLLEQTSGAEFLALLLRDRMSRGGRVQLDDVELSIEPAAAIAEDPSMWVAGPDPAMRRPR